MTMPTQSPLPNIRDAESAYLSANAQVEAFIAKFMNDWYNPIAETTGARAWSGLPEPAKEYARAAHPEAAANMDGLFAGKQAPPPPAPVGQMPLGGV